MCSVLRSAVGYALGLVFHSVTALASKGKLRPEGGWGRQGLRERGGREEHLSPQLLVPLMLLLAFFPCMALQMAALQELSSKVSLERSALLAASYLMVGAQRSFILKRPRIVISQSGKMSVTATGCF